MGLSASSGSLLVLHLNVLFTPHAWTPRDLGFSLLIIGVLSGIHLSWPSSAVWVTDARVTSPSLCCQGHINTSWWSTSDHSSAPWLALLVRHWPMPLVGPSLRGPPLLAVNKHRAWDKGEPREVRCNPRDEEPNLNEGGAATDRADGHSVQICISWRRQRSPLLPVFKEEQHVHLD